MAVNVVNPQVGGERICGYAVVYGRRMDYNHDGRRGSPGGHEAGGVCGRLSLVRVRCVRAGTGEANVVLLQELI